MRTWKVGELARRAGLTVRTLHHWDQIGLFSPTRRTDAGYRLYTEDDLVRLQHVLLLKHLGMELRAIRVALGRTDTSLADVLLTQIARLEDRIERDRRLVALLRRIRGRFDQAGEAPYEELFTAMEMMMMHEEYFTKEQLQEIAAHREEIGAEAIRAAEAEWPKLIARVRAAMERGEDPGSPEVQGLARRWSELVEMFTRGDPKIAGSVRRMYANEPALQQRTGLDEEIMEYVGRAVQVAVEPPQEP